MRQDKQFTQALLKFSEAAQHLSEVWQSLDHTGDSWMEQYPFDKSFDDVSSDITKWFLFITVPHFSVDSCEPVTIAEILESNKHECQEIKQGIMFCRLLKVGQSKTVGVVNIKRLS